MSRKVFEGTVVSDKMTKTLVVIVSRKYAEQKLGKIVSSRKKYKIHCEDSSVKTGDVVRFEECRPMSKDKKFRFTGLVKKSETAAQIKEDV
jgi:small subunit ribosomal protein S17